MVARDILTVWQRPADAQVFTWIALSPVRGVPVHDDRLLFEFLILEGAQTAFMQAIGMVNDHTTDCFRYGEIRDLEQA